MHTIKVYYGSRLYGNRIIGETLPEPKYTFENINFILGDGISTYQTLNNINSEDSPTYLTATDESGITTLWYVIASQKTRKNQLTLSLKRDFLDEDWDKLKNQPFICTKSATIPDDISDAKYKKTMNLSQVKQKEILLKDISQNDGWFVFYLSKPHMIEKVTEISTTDESGKTTTESVKSLVMSEDYISGKTFADRNMSITFCDKSRMTHTETANYDVFVVPVGGPVYFSKDGGEQLRSNMNKLQVYRVAQILSLNLGSVIYDIQYLPYVTEHTFSIGSGYAIIKLNNKEIGFGQILTTAEEHGNIHDNADIKALRDEYNALKSPLEKRKFHEKYMFRLTSPNYQASFDFSIVKNDTFPSFKVDIALKPYTPYIYVYPTFSGLYGHVFHDGRGLILSGDFSIDRTDSAWTNYKLQNKNYEASFNRGIQSLDLNNTYQSMLAEQQKQEQWVGGVTKTIGDALQGGLNGFVASGFNPWGGVISGAVAGVSSGIGAGMDIRHGYQNREMERNIRDDNRQAQMDNFNYQIGNVQAMPSTLTKISAINPNYKVYPILEIYKCTTQEEKNLEYSIKYNGLDINLMTTLSIFDHGYISGSIIKFPSDLNINESQSQAINQELQNGIYYKEV